MRYLGIKNGTVKVSLYLYICMTLWKRLTYSLK
ncbi:hypothetical protein [Methanosarcina thermophila]